MYHYSTVSSNTCSKSYKWPLTLLALMALLLTACDEYNEDSNTDPSEKESENVWLFESEQAQTEAGGKEQDSVRSNKTRVKMAPASDLVPGDARAEVDEENPFAGMEEAIAAGEQHFAAFNCAGCHAPMGGGGMGPPLSDTEWIYGDKPAQIYNSIVQGRGNGMPAFGSMLPEEVVWQLVAYVKTLNEKKQAFVKDQENQEQEDTATGEGDSSTENSGIEIDFPGDGAGGE